ncbi:unnamed protein product [Dibothriocephalus latus]|uniref:RING-type domain-containing protein n=1 Tax=Dibothriocephalus latus TaxID=60516 RepID=A0A3P6SEC1_DIBLA|nr:unnamed protein product [Dibothriocephalus latus]
MIVHDEDLQQALECAYCLETCKAPYRLPCEHFFCKEPCLQKLLHVEQPICPLCREVFSEVDVKPFRLADNLLELIEKAKRKRKVDLLEKEEGEVDLQEKEKGEVDLQEKEKGEVDLQEKEKGEVGLQEKEKDEVDLQEKEKGEVDLQEKEKSEVDLQEKEKGEVDLQEKEKGEASICPICFRQVETPLRRSELFSELVCEDCWSSGEMLRNISIEEINEEKIRDNNDNRGEGESQKNQRGEAAVCPICIHLAKSPLRMSEHFSQLVCEDCWSSGETLRKIIMDEPNGGKIAGNSNVIKEGDLQNSRQEENAFCPVCLRLVKPPLQRSELFSEMVCENCWSTGELLSKLAIEETVKDELRDNSNIAEIAVPKTT